MWWVVIVIVVIVWGVVGATFPSTGSNGGPPTGGGCDSCKGLDLWWFGLNPMQKVLQLMRYLYKKGDCLLKGCPT